MAALLMAVALSATPQYTSEIRDHVDWIQFQTLLDEKTRKPIYTQTIFWDLDSEGWYEVVDWRLYREGSITRRNGLWVYSFYDPKYPHVFRTVTAYVLSRDDSLYDWERQNQLYLAPEDRRLLTKAPRPPQ